MSTTRRMPMIDALKAVASQIVLLHHFSSYGPLAETARDLLPGLLGWLYDYGRMAVQVFLVVAGFLAARGLSPQGDALAASPLPLLWKRYQRLIIPFLAAIGIAIIGSAIADHWMDDDAIPARAGFAQWLAHATLLHSVLGVDSLSAGVWYVAIDFQLFALMALLLWAGRRAFVAPLLVLSVGAASLFWFNRNPDLDNWAIYFFGSYALGAAAWWASDPRRLSAWTGVIATVAIAALVVDFRLRIALALGVALLLAVGRRSGLLERWPDVAPLPILLLANGLFVQLGGETAGAAMFGLLAAWTVSLLAATAFYRWIEGPEASRRIADGLGSLFARTREMLRLVPRRLRRLLGA